MDEKRYAILIGNSDFPREPELENLQYPVKDIDGLEQVLISEDHGYFTDISKLANADSSSIRVKINQTLRKAKKNDLVLIYYSGHGKLNPAGGLCLASFDTVFDSLEATSVRVDDIRSYIDISPTRKVILLLDCCYSGAAGKAFANTKSAISDQLQLTASGRGICIITASTGTQVAQEKESGGHGLFTKHVINGIKDKDTDVDGDGFISSEELYNYVSTHIKDDGFQVPMKWDLDVRGKLIVAKSSRKPREEQREKIRARLLQMAGEENLSDRILTDAMKIIGLPAEAMSGHQKRFNALLNDLVEKNLSARRFTDIWIDIMSTSEQIPTEEVQKTIKSVEKPKEKETLIKPVKKEKEKIPDKKVKTELPTEIPQEKRRLIYSLIAALLVISGIMAYFIGNLTEDFVFFERASVLWLIPSVIAIVIGIISYRVRLWILTGLPIIILYNLLILLIYSIDGIKITSDPEVIYLVGYGFASGISLLVWSWESIREIKYQISTRIVSLSKNGFWTTALFIGLIQATNLIFLPLICMFRYPDDDFVPLYWLAFLVLSIIGGFISLRKRLWYSTALSWVTLLIICPLYVRAAEFYHSTKTPSVVVPLVLLIITTVLMVKSYRELNNRRSAPSFSDK